ncbi:MAG: hypothetical protein K2I16_08435 [Muribaculaceae bacterium]|nr:hypothetical protein [Muribaculaceae bacterium]
MNLEPLKEENSLTPFMLSRVLGGEDILLPTLTVTPGNKGDGNDGDDSDEDDSDDQVDPGAGGTGGNGGK